MTSLEVVFSETQQADVDRLAIIRGTTREQLARTAVALLSYLRDESADGADIVVKRPDGTETAIVGFTDD